MFLIETLKNVIKTHKYPVNLTQKKKKKGAKNMLVVLLSFLFHHYGTLRQNLKTTSLNKSSTPLKLRLTCFIKFFQYGTLSLTECSEGISLERCSTLPPAAHKRPCSWKTTCTKQQHLTQPNIQLPRKCDWPRLWHNIYRNTVVSFFKSHVHFWNSTWLPFMCLSAFFSFL